MMGVEANLCIAHASAYAGRNYIHVDMYIFIYTCQYSGFKLI